MENIELYSCEELWVIYKNNTKRLIKKAKGTTHISLSDYEEIVDNNQSLIIKFKITNIKKVFSLDYIQFEKIYNKCKTSYNIDNIITLGSNNYIETPVQFINFLTDFQIIKKPVVIKDDLNNIKYEIGLASPEYCMSLFNYMFKLKVVDTSINIFSNSFLNYVFNEMSNDINTNDIIHINICEYLSYTLAIFTIKIKVEKEKSISLKKLLNTFNFNAMIRCGYTYDFPLNINELFHIDINKNANVNPNNLAILSAPMQIYQELIVDYYRLALSSNEPFSQYISYYHILEYFFDKVFNENLRKDFQKKITTPHFSYKDDNELDMVIDFIKKKTKDCKENGQGNELESLKLVLKKYIKIVDLKNRLNIEQIEYYQQHKITFSNAPTISFKDELNFYTHLAKRIYQTRNALVHSKEGNVGRYKPYQDNEELQKEIPLIKLVAEQIIINLSAPL